MFHKATPHCSILLLGRRLACTAALALAVALSFACEDKGLGRPCDITTDAAPLQAAYIINATDCPTRLCIKPAVQPGVSSDGFDTSAYCSTPCTSDSDCDGQTRDPSNRRDTRCKRGFQCAPVFGEGDLCCKKLCLCRDFVSATAGPVTPEACQGGATTCK